MSPNKFPAGWDEKKVQRVLAHYEEQSEDDALLEDEAGVAPSATVMKIPLDLVPKVRGMIVSLHHARKTSIARNGAVAGGDGPKKRNPEKRRSKT